eukprot:1340128-Amorphochlora_amoeboformis.AAC.1
MKSYYHLCAFVSRTTTVLQGRRFLTLLRGRRGARCGDGEGEGCPGADPEVLEVLEALNVRGDSGSIQACFLANSAFRWGLRVGFRRVLVWSLELVGMEDGLGCGYVHGCM